MPTPTIQSWRPNIRGKAHPAVEHAINLIFDAIQDHDTAIVGVNAKAQANTTAVAKATAASSTTSTSTTSGTVLGAVNNQTGTAYTLQLTDNGSIVTLSNAAAITLSLNSTLPIPFVCWIENLGVGSATLTPTAGNVNGVASISLGINQSCFAVWSGVGWFCATSPKAALALVSAAHQFVTAYNAVTGVFSTAQPSFADVSGIAAVGQGGTGTTSPGLVAGSNVTITGSWPNQTVAASITGLSVTIVTAKLTVGGTNGSMTYSNGLLTAQTPAT